MANFCSGAFDISKSETSGSSVERWRRLVDELAVWFSNRPPELQPMVELDDAKSPFPIIFFTHGAGIFANQLYHTAMLLLLHNKPRTVRFTERVSPMASPLWHSQRICGMALNNDKAECWDLCLIASLQVAARHMTHQSQQIAILQGFGRIKSITGWNIDGCLDVLRKQWQVLDAF